MATDGAIEVRHLCPHTLFFFNDSPTPELYTLSLHDALPICALLRAVPRALWIDPGRVRVRALGRSRGDRKSTRLNSSHITISYAVFCLKKKINQHNPCPHLAHICAGRAYPVGRGNSETILCI